MVERWIVFFPVVVSGTAALLLLLSPLLLLSLLLLLLRLRGVWLYRCAVLNKIILTPAAGSANFRSILLAGTVLGGEVASVAVEA